MWENRNGFSRETHETHEREFISTPSPRPQAVATAAANAAAWKARFPAPSFGTASRSTPCRAGGQAFPRDWKVVEHGMAGEDGGRGADGNGAADGAG